jgi:hypothetical protein
VVVGGGAVVEQRDGVEGGVSRGWGRVVGGVVEAVGVAGGGVEAGGEAL